MPYGRVFNDIPSAGDEAIDTDKGTAVPGHVHVAPVIRPGCKSQSTDPVLVFLYTAGGGHCLGDPGHAACVGNHCWRVTNLFSGIITGISEAGCK